MIKINNIYLLFSYDTSIYYIYTKLQIKPLFHRPKIMFIQPNKQRIDHGNNNITWIIQLILKGQEVMLWELEKWTFNEDQRKHKDAGRGRCCFCRLAPLLHPACSGFCCSRMKLTIVAVVSWSSFIAACFTMLLLSMVRSRVWHGQRGEAGLVF